MKKFDGKTVIVTGGGGGIGGATCRRFAAEGAKVAVYDLNLVAAEASAATRFRSYTATLAPSAAKRLQVAPPMPPPPPVTITVLPSNFFIEISIRG